MALFAHNLFHSQSMMKHSYANSTNSSLILRAQSLRDGSAASRRFASVRGRAHVMQERGARPRKQGPQCDVPIILTDVIFSCAHPNSESTINCPSRASIRLSTASPCLSSGPLLSALLHWHAQLGRRGLSALPSSSHGNELSNAEPTPAATVPRARLRAAISHGMSFHFDCADERECGYSVLPLGST